MSQQDVRDLLLELGGGATIHELAEQARKQFPDRTLDTYLSERLQPMKKKGFVEEVDGRWRLTEKGRATKVDYPIHELDGVIGEDELAEYGLTISNIVGTLHLDRELRLEELSNDIESTDYNPEMYPSMVYRPNDLGSTCVLCPASGRLVVVGAKSKAQLIQGTQDFLGRLLDLGIAIEKGTDNILIQNIVANFDIKREIDLHMVSIGLGLENVEYDSEQFPGLIYRGSLNSTILLFTSGKSVITGSKTFFESVQARNDIIRVLNGIGVDLDVNEKGVTAPR